MSRSVSSELPPETWLLTVSGFYFRVKLAMPHTSRYREKTSTYKGVSYKRRYKTWRAAIKIGAKQFELGNFKDAVSAANAYDAAARLLNMMGLKNSELNFPERPASDEMLDAAAERICSRKGCPAFVIQRIRSKFP